MKIGLLTFFESDNYGTVLQAYALQSYLERIGHETTLIWLRRNVNARGVYHGNIPRNYTISQKIWHKLVQIRTAKAAQRKIQHFAKFRNDHLHVTPICFDSGLAFVQHLDGYDLLISGGDQIWNPYHKVFSMDYMLNFLPETFPRIAYGSSFGVDEIQGQELKSKFSQALNKYSAIGVREKSATQILSDLGVTGTQVLDPVFLDRQLWDNLISKKSPLKKKYGVIYALVDYPDETDQAIRKFSRENGLEMVILPENRRNCMNNYRKAFDLSPVEFLRYIKYSEIVFTNSFHGLAFAILFHKQVVVLEPVSEDAKKKKIRLQELLHLLGIQGRNLRNIDDPIDYELVDRKLNELVDRSHVFLQDTLREIERGSYNEQDSF